MNKRDQFDPGTGFMQTPSRIEGVRTSAEAGPSALTPGNARTASRIQGATEMTPVDDQQGGIGTNRKGDISGSGRPSSTNFSVHNPSASMNSPAAARDELSAGQGTNRRPGM